MESGVCDGPSTYLTYRILTRSTQRALANEGVVVTLTT